MCAADGLLHLFEAYVVHECRQCLLLLLTEQQDDPAVKPEEGQTVPVPNLPQTGKKLHSPWLDSTKAHTCLQHIAAVDVSVWRYLQI